MKPDTLLACAQAFNNLIGTKYIIHLGRAGKLAKFAVTFEKEDCFHLMGLHYLIDRRDNRNRGIVLDDLLTNPRYRHRVASSKHWIDDYIPIRILIPNCLDRLLLDHRAAAYNLTMFP